MTELSETEAAIVARDPRTALLDPRIPARTSINPKTGCWEWQGYRMPQGYGQIGFGRAIFLVHRVAWATLHGEIPPNGFICHHCDNPPCWNPDHLFLGDVRINSQDMATKGRGRNDRSSWTHCLQGHELAGSNLYIEPKRGFRSCRTCRVEIARRANERKRSAPPITCDQCSTSMTPGNLHRHMRRIHGKGVQ